MSIILNNVESEFEYTVKTGVHKRLRNQVELGFNLCVAPSTMLVLDFRSPGSVITARVLNTESGRTTICVKYLQGVR